MCVRVCVTLFLCVCMSVCVCVCVYVLHKVKNDKLGLRVPVWVNAVDVIPGGGAQPIVAVGTGHHQVCDDFYV